MCYKNWRTPDDYGLLLKVNTIVCLDEIHDMDANCALIFTLHASIDLVATTLEFMGVGEACTSHLTT